MRFHSQGVVDFGGFWRVLEADFRLDAWLFMVYVPYITIHIRSEKV